MSVQRELKFFFLGIVTAAIVNVVYLRICSQPFRRRHADETQDALPLQYATCKKRRKGGAYLDLIGRTRLVRLHRLSEDLGIEVWGKAEFMNPGGSVKDRVAKAILEDSEDRGLIEDPGDIITEGTSGSTGISLTLAANCRQYKAQIFMPNDQAQEKSAILKVLGAQVVMLPPCSIIDPRHYCNAARKAAHDAVKAGRCRAVYANQFENPANFQAHYHGTGEEIWYQSGGKLDAFVASSGTGGTIAGTGSRLKEYNPAVKIILADPQGSGLYNKIRYGVLYDPKDAEGHRTRIITDTIVEGVGINRLTHNFSMGMRHIDYAYKISDLEAVHMSRYLIATEGLFLGSSSALNCCAVVKAVRDGVLPKGSRVVVLLCDSGVRHVSRLYNNAYLQEQGLLPLYAADNADCWSPPRGYSSTLNSVKAACVKNAPVSVFDFVN